ncbi:phosphatidate cytidylyltransferase [Sphingorhabdus sp. YGSMI21]|uniref:phosphatidate cytidylyltransferase n=1 Tax=Sphingorhabdus sp. YGSMI21 TaxID=2077182 RepID=UPI000C1E97F7|nr:phosphatidate cytidylyltransferase [Sphingorhabdus sp. YGSMI21]ATW05184.1 phosphatidate cytidylyltransferase [Sphingorhabdus sp. YGSMI21]
MADPAAPAPGKGSELQTRIIVGILLIGAALLAGYFGGMALWLLAVLMSLGIMSEWAGLTDRRDKRLLAMYALSVPLAIMSPWAAGPSFLAFGLILGAAMFVAIFDRSIKLAAGVIYAGLPALAVLYLREIDNGILVMLWTLALVWATDIGAYFSGRAIGGPKLAPQYSPNKTWAGLIGGVILTAALSFALHVYWGLPSGLVLLSIPLAVLAQMGDLFESWLKRKAGAKDSGTIFPGHGGVMDRLDGLIPVAPVVALIMLVDRWPALS